MLHFLSYLFSPSTDRPSDIDDALIEAATDRVIEGTDKRLQALGSYRRKLREPVEKALVHVINLVDALPEPVEISRRTFSSDPRLRAFFSSFNHMQEKVGAAKSVEAYLKQAPASDNGRIYGLLSMQWAEQNRLGAKIQFGSLAVRAEYEYFDVSQLNDVYLTSIGLSYTF